MDAMELYALATQMESAQLKGEDGRPLHAADLFSALEYLWERGVDLEPALAGRRVPVIQPARPAL